MEGYNRHTDHRIQMEYGNGRPGRSVLQENVVVCRLKDTQNTPVIFKLSQSDENHKDAQPQKGGSVICYQAILPEVGKGILKEFYPSEPGILERKESGQLVLCPQTNRKDFEQQRDAYLGPLQKLIELKQNRQDYELEAFIPEFEIFQGCFADGSRSDGYYVWSPASRMFTFEEVCSRVRNARTYTAYMLAKGIAAIHSLTQSILTLHNNGILHNDIKPANFGFPVQNGLILSDSVRLFDVNSLTRMGKTPAELHYTPGYSEPEVGKKAATIQSDLYSIGATLYAFLQGSVRHNGTNETGFVGQNETSYVRQNGTSSVTWGPLFQQENYDKLEDFVSSLALLDELGKEHRQEVEKKLLCILQGTLAKRKDRYACCEYLLKDLDELLFLMMPFLHPSTIQKRRTWVLKELDHIMQEETGDTLSLHLMYHLFTHPLFPSPDVQTQARQSDAQVQQVSQPDAQTSELYPAAQIQQKTAPLQVVVFGLQAAGSKLTDLILQAAQVPGQRLDLQVYYEEEKDLEQYLDERPALKDFVQINDESPAVPHPYACIRFEKLFQKAPHDKQTLEETQIEICQKADHVFIALSAEQKNKKLVTSLYERKKEAGCSGMLHWIQTRPSSVPESLLPSIQNERLSVHPIEIFREPGKLPGFALLERMAFNSHLLWEDSLHIDYDSLYQAFLDPYHYASSLQHAMCIPGMVAAAGVAWNPESPQTSAAEFRAIMQSKDPENQKLRHAAIAAEHRRWVLEKAADGWQKLDDFTQLKTGSTRHKTQKRHICMVDCRADEKLKEQSADFWQSGSTAELDPLDKLSVDLHRYYQKKAKELGAAHGSENRLMHHIESLCRKDSEIMQTFLLWKHLVKEVWNQDGRAAEEWRSVHQRLQQQASRLQPEEQGALEVLLSAFEEVFYPCLAVTMYRDFKELDARYIDHMDFVIGYSQNVHLMIPWEASSETASPSKTFDKAAAALLVSPASVVYLADLGHASVSSIAKEARKLKVLFDKKNVRSQMVWMVCGSARQAERLEKKVREIFGSRLISFKYTGTELGSLLQAAREQMEQNQEDGQKYILEKNNAFLSGYMEGLGMYGHYPYYRLNPRSRQFVQAEGCEELQWIRTQEALLVSDLAAFQHARLMGAQTPEYDEKLEQLQNFYVTHTSLWKQMCGKIAEACSASDYEAVFSFLPEATCFKQGTNTAHQEPKTITHSLQDAQNTAFAEQPKTETFAREACENGLQPGKEEPGFHAGKPHIHDIQDPSDAMVQMQKRDGLNTSGAAPELEEKVLKTSGAHHKLKENALKTDAARQKRNAHPLADSNAADNAETTASFRMPAETAEVLQSILKALKQRNLAGKDSCVMSCTPNEVEVVLVASDTIVSVMEQLLARPELLLQMKPVQIRYDTKKHCLMVRIQTLRITGLELNDQSRKFLAFMKENGFIHSIDENPEGTAVSFTFSSRKSRELFESAGRILEVLVYSKLRKTGRFDDLVSGFELEWEEGGFTNELDLIATAGFQTFIFECKARPVLHQDFYHKLHTLGERIGIYPTIVLVADTREKSRDQAETNQKLRHTGELDNIWTITDLKDILSIGELVTQTVF